MLQFFHWGFWSILLVSAFYCFSSYPGAKPDEVIRIKPDQLPCIIICCVLLWHVATLNPFYAFYIYIYIWSYTICVFVYMYLCVYTVHTNTRAHLILVLPVKEAETFCNISVMNHTAAGFVLMTSCTSVWVDAPTALSYMHTHKLKVASLSVLSSNITMYITNMGWEPFMFSLLYLLPMLMPN